MASLGSVVVQFLADDKMSKTVGKITDGLKDFNKKAGDSDGKAGKLGGTLKKGLAVGAAAAGTALIAMGGFMMDAAAAAIADKKEADNLARTLGSLEGVTQDVIDANAKWIDSMELATGVADSDLREAMSKLALATGDVGEAQRLTTVAVDAAAGSGKNLSTITDALAKAADGNTAALKRQFPWLDANNDGTVTLTEAVDGLTDAYGGSAEAASNLDPWKKLKTIWGQLKEQLGQWVLPLIDEFGDWFKDKKNQKAIQDIVEKVGNLAKKMGEKLVPAIEDFLDWIGSEEGKKSMREFADTAEDVATSLGAIATAIVKIIEWWRKIPAPLRGALGGGGGSLRFWDRSATSASAAPAGPATMATGPAPAPPPIFVTEDMVAQSVASLLNRSAGRRGRLVMVS